MTGDEKPNGRKPKGKIRRKVFTDTNVLSLPARAKGYMIWDGGRGRNSDDVCRGLGIWVTPLGAKSYISMFYFPGSSRSHSHKLGRTDEITLAKARELCRQDRAKARAGVDPRIDNVSNSDTFKDAVDEYINRVQIAQDRRLRAEEARRVLLADTKDWYKRPIGSIRAQELRARLELVRDGDVDGNLKPRPYLANLLYSRMKPFFAWCADPSIGKITTSPITFKKPFRGATRRERDWFKGATADEAIKTIWNAADKLGNKVAGKYLKVLLLTGKRRTALAEMRWEHVDEHWFWNAPGGRSKEKRLHAAPLSSLVQRILHPRQQTGFVFPGKRGGRIVVSSSLTRSIIKAGAHEDFFLHGLRHICETKMAEFKIPAHVRDRLFDHASGRGSGKVYDHHEYEDEMMAALEKWASYIEGLVQPEGIALLR
jgi:integrase